MLEWLLTDLDTREYWLVEPCLETRLLLLASQTRDRGSPAPKRSRESGPNAID